MYMDEEDALNEKALKDVTGGDFDVPGVGELGVYRCTGCGEEWKMPGPSTAKNAANK